MISYILLGTASPLAIALMLLGSAAYAQQLPAPTDSLIAIVTGNKFQQIIPPNKIGTDRRALTIQNNNTNSDSCWVYIGSDKASKENSIALDPSGSYVRYWPFASSDAIQATCASSSDTLLVEYQ